MKLVELLKDSAYKLTQFSQAQIATLEAAITTKLTEKSVTPYVVCLVRNKPVIRDYMAEHCRILAVVGLHGNVFKPHTGTKTSVIFLQKWNDDAKAGMLCPKLDD